MEKKLDMEALLGLRAVLGGAAPAPAELALLQALEKEEKEKEAKA